MSQKNISATILILVTLFLIGLTVFTGQYSQDDGAALQEAILRKIKGSWFIADIKPIQIHF